jgi:hypothetical protein
MDAAELDARWEGDESEANADDADGGRRLDLVEESNGAWRVFAASGKSGHASLNPPIQFAKVAKRSTESALEPPLHFQALK